MKSRSLCALIVLCSAASTSIAAEGPQLLSAAEMDAVAAGAGPTAGIDAIAAAVGDFAFTQTAGTALTVASAPLSSNPASTGWVAVSAGVASATGYGNGAATGTSVTPSASVPGSSVRTFTIDHHVSSNGTEIRAAAVVKFGSYAPAMVMALMK